MLCAFLASSSRPSVIGISRTHAARTGKVYNDRPWCPKWTRPDCGPPPNMNNIPRSAVEEDFWFLPRGLFVDVVSAPTERPWPRAEIWLAAGQHNPDNPDDPLVFELRLYGPRPGHGELILMTVRASRYCSWSLHSQPGP